MVRKPSVKLRFRYWFDKTMARGTPALIGWLLAMCLVIVVPASVLLVWSDVDTPTTLENQLIEIWKNISGTFNLGGAVGSPVFVLMSLLLALVGLFFASTLVGLITSGVRNKIMDLRRGRSMVLEQGHTVLLGWSDQVVPIISELSEANANQRQAAVAILAEKDKTEMEDEIHARVPATDVTQVICRTGSPAEPTDIGRVSPHTARSVIVLTPGNDDGDNQIVKVLLALAKSSRRERQSCHMVAVVQNGKKVEAARLAGGSQAYVLSADDITARLIVQTSRQSGFSAVFAELLSFAGDEFYMTGEPKLVGKTFGDALLAYDTSSVVGVQHADGMIALNPPSETRIRDDDQIIAISQDDDTVIVSDFPYVIDIEAIVTPRPHEDERERTLLLGWNRRAPVIIRQLGQYAARNSALDVIASGADAQSVDEVIDAQMNRLNVSFQEGDITDPGVLRGLNIGSYDRIVVLGDDIETQEADSRTLLVLLFLRNLEHALGRRVPVVAELRDDRNRALAPLSEDADFIVISKLISLLMTQISENRHLSGLFDELFSARGSEIYIKPADGYVVLDREIDFYTVVESARRQGQAAIGYRRQEESSLPPSYGIHLNPDKKQRLSLTAGDAVIVVAQE
ncbi:putative lipoprotein [Streptomyces sp. NBRC 110611]|uniref:CASTOR/POLLUX-related putative ion channel n=1 Tax=Streptomyces sp. NBRC 110611 TaxID=1621259 RepID=UPI000829ECAF|nr:hypothetical protein [Streptomyces sp. NBRC 110611]GAU71494.1 putative lipoprotein [Streptomyces sp. NBRC 110611]